VDVLTLAGLYAEIYLIASLDTDTINSFYASKRAPLESREFMRLPIAKDS